MPYNTQPIKRDVQNAPIPQYFNPETDVYEPSQGRNGAQRVELYGPKGQPIQVSGDKLAVRASEIEAILGEVSAVPTTNTIADRLKQIADRLGNALNVQLTGSYLQDGQAMFVRGSTKNETETIINAQSVSASGDTGWVTVDTKNASKIVLLINCDMSWKLEVGHPWSLGAGAGKEHQYPDCHSSPQTPKALMNYPRAVAIGFSIDTATSLIDALDKAIVFSPLRIRIVNQDTSNTATVTVRVMRFWR